jgi:hypothetical protein
MDNKEEEEIPIGLYVVIIILLLVGLIYLYRKIRPFRGVCNSLREGRRWRQLMRM